MSNTTNVIATLPARASVESASAAAATALKIGPAITGQYLYERFCANKADQTKMHAVINATNAVDTASWKAALKDMVAIAEKHGESAKKTAQNCRSGLQNIYGAIRFAPDSMKLLGFEHGKTGYHQAEAMARKALKDNGIKWTGEKAKSPEQREQEAQARIRKQAMAKALQDTPMRDGETQAEFFERVAKQGEQEEQAMLVEREGKKIGKLVESVKAMCGEHLQAVIVALLDEANVELVDSES